MNRAFLVFSTAVTVILATGCTRKEEPAWDFNKSSAPVSDVKKNLPPVSTPAVPALTAPSLGATESVAKKSGALTPLPIKPIALGTPHRKSRGKSHHRKAKHRGHRKARHGRHSRRHK